MDSSTASGGPLSSATLARAGPQEGGLCRELSSSNILVLPTELILKIFLLSDGKTIGRGRCMSRDWFNRLSRLDHMVTHLTTNGGEGVVLHLDNPLKDIDCGRLSLYIFDTRVEVPLTAPFDWKWFTLVGSAMGKVCVRFSIDGRSSSLVIWNPFSSWRSLITDPGSDCYHFNHRDDCSVYAFVGLHGSDDYRIISLTKRHLASVGYDMNVYESDSSRWTPCVRTLAMVDRLCNRYAVSNQCVFWINSEGRFRKKPVSVVRYSTLDSVWSEIEIGVSMCVEHAVLIGRKNGVDFVSYERSATRFGVHLVAINIIGTFGGMEWGRSLFIGEPNMTETPCGLLSVDLLGISHFIRGFDVFDPSFHTAVSEAQFRTIGLRDGVVRFVGRMRWGGVVSIKSIVDVSLCV